MCAYCAKNGHWVRIFLKATETYASIVGVKMIFIKRKTIYKETSIGEGSWVMKELIKKHWQDYVNIELIFIVLSIEAQYSSKNIQSMFNTKLALYYFIIIYNVSRKDCPV